MKTFEIQVVREYTTIVRKELPNNWNEDDVHNILAHAEGHEHLSEDFWDTIYEQELIQCNSETTDIEIKELITS